MNKKFRHLLVLAIFTFCVIFQGLSLPAGAVNPRMLRLKEQALVKQTAARSNGFFKDYETAVREWMTLAYFTYSNDEWELAEEMCKAALDLISEMQRIYPSIHVCTDEKRNAFHLLGKTYVHTERFSEAANAFEEEAKVCSGIEAQWYKQRAQRALEKATAARRQAKAAQS